MEDKEGKIKNLASVSFLVFVTWGIILHLPIIIVNGVYQSYSSTKSLVHVEAPISASLNRNHFSLLH